MLSLAQNTFHHNPRLRGPVSSLLLKMLSGYKYKSLAKCTVYVQSR